MRVTTPGGGRLQMGIPRDLGEARMPYLVRGVVMAVYVRDDPQHPYFTSGQSTDTFCDVLVYTSLPGGRYYLLSHVLVAPDQSGVQHGRIRRPKAATGSIDGRPLAALGTGLDPAQLNGDHVLVGFIDGDRHAPIVVRHLPHPGKDAGNSPLLAAGARQGLRMVDGDPDFVKHHGSYYGVSKDGDFVTDTVLANDGTALPGSGGDPPAGSTGQGHQIARVNKTAEHRRQAMDATLPAAQIELLRETLSVGGLELDMKALEVLVNIHNLVGNALKLNGAGPLASLQVGTGDVHAAIAEALQTFWNGTVVPYLQNMRVPTAFGPSGMAQDIPTQATALSGSMRYPVAITSDKLSFPNKTT